MPLTERHQREVESAGLKNSSACFYLHLVASIKASCSPL